MGKKIKIGIMGAPLVSENMGCLALTYSLLSCLEEIGKTSGHSFTYIIFDWSQKDDRIRLISQKTGIPESRIKFRQYSLLDKPLKVLYHFIRTIKMFVGIANCDCFIDLTEGDSFSDIYGDDWFKGRTRIKILIEKLGKPLLLGPQTYGPFINNNNYKMAMEAIVGADLVIARDEKSQGIVKEMGRRDVILTSDLAFCLPYRPNKIADNKIKVGINASRLLSNNDEMKQKNFKLSVSYMDYICDLLSTLICENNYRIYLISHVSGDYAIHENLKKKYPQVELVPVFDNPIDAKSFISNMDIFVGARMHGTIAAYTTGVACIPTAYSQKFRNLFKGFEYNYIIDLTTETNKEALVKTMTYIHSYQKLIQSEFNGKAKSEQLVNQLKSELASWIEKISMNVNCKK